VCESETLLKYHDAGRVARKALNTDRPVVYYPLGLERAVVQGYKVIKLSAFLFRDPRQRAAWERAFRKFEQATGCGPELLAVRRSAGDRRQGSIADVARAIYELIRRGELNPTKALNLTRLSDEVERACDGYREGIDARKREAADTLAERIDPRNMAPDAALTGLYVSAEDVFRM
jgi:hypothetical protein